MAEAGGGGKGGFGAPEENTDGPRATPPPPPKKKKKPAKGVVPARRFTLFGARERSVGTSCPEELLTLQDTVPERPRVEGWGGGDTGPVTSMTAYRSVYTRALTQVVSVEI